MTESREDYVELSTLIENDPVFAAKHAAAERDYTIQQTCGGCPEIYDVHKNGVYVGYMRLRGGYFRAVHGDSALVYDAHPDADGVFDYDERPYYLARALVAIRDREEGLSLTEQDSQRLEALVSAYCLNPRVNDRRHFDVLEGDDIVGFLFMDDERLEMRAGDRHGWVVYEVDRTKECPNEDAMRLHGLDALRQHRETEASYGAPGR